MLAPDIVEKVRRDFEKPDKVDLALSVLADFVDQNQDLSSDRILRCIVFVADGDLDMLEKAIDLAKIDYGDLIVWAEYNGEERRLRDLSNAFL